MDQTFNFPTEEIELPSKGLIYPEGNPLSSGKVIMKYMKSILDMISNLNILN